MFLTLLKHKLILLVVLFSTPVFSQIYGEDETNDCPDCCVPRTPPSCVAIPGKGCLKSDPKPVCESQAEAKVAAEVTKDNLKEELAVLEKKRDTMRDTLHHARDNLSQHQAHYDTLQGMFNAECGDTSNGLGQRVSRRFPQKECEPGGACRGRPNYWIPLNGRCGATWCAHDRETGNTKDADWDNNQNLCVDADGSGITHPVNVGKWVYKLVLETVPCGKIIGAVYELTQDPSSPKKQCDVVTQLVKTNYGWDATWVEL